MPRPTLARDFTLSRSPRFVCVAPFEVAYVREQGEYSHVSAPLAWRRLDECTRAARACFGGPVGASHDDPNVNAPELLRYDAGVLLGPAQAPPVGTSKACWGEGRHAVFDFYGPYRAIAAGFDTVFRWWPQRRWPALRSAPFLEVYRNVPGHVPTELWFPVEESGA